MDPTKVTRTALQNAASIAALLLTTEALICEKPEKEKAIKIPLSKGSRMPVIESGEVPGPAIEMPELPPPAEGMSPPPSSPGEEATMPPPPQEGAAPPPPSEEEE
jgi:hypothetical protein